MQMESAGNSVAIRREPKYLQMYGKTKKFQEIVKATGLSPEDIATSYGLMQLMVMTAWGSSRVLRNSGIAAALAF